MSVISVTHAFLPENGDSVNVTFTTDPTDEWLTLYFNGDGPFALPILDESDALSTFTFGATGIDFTAADINAMGILADEFFAFIDTL